MDNPKNDPWKRWKQLDDKKSYRGGLNPRERTEWTKLKVSLGLNRPYPLN